MRSGFFHGLWGGCCHDLLTKQPFPRKTDISPENNLGIIINQEEAKEDKVTIIRQ
ncbi:MAG: hypothetical protein ACERKO_08760 [Acetanaerobacterium sp.]